MNNRASQLATKLSAAWSFLMPILIHIDEETLNTYAEDEKLKEFKFDLEKINKKRNHVLSDKEEKLIAQAGLVLDNTYSTYMIFSNVAIELENAEEKDEN